MTSSLNSIPFENKSGETVTLADFDAKAYLIVNVASKCGLTPQYENLQALYAQYHDKGLEILAFPANEFLAQEPGTNAEIQDFCATNYQVTFPVNHKIVVKGEGQHPLYAALTEAKAEAVKSEDGSFEALLNSKGLITGDPHDIKWNFEKFLLNGKGEVVARYFPDIASAAPRFMADIEGLLAA